MSPEINILPDVEALHRAAAAEFVEAAVEAIKARGRFDVVLSGGSTPKGLYSLLAGNPQIAWDNVNFFWGDERHVPADHPDSNFRMANESLLMRLRVKSSQVFRMAGENPDAAKAASDYESQLRHSFGDQSLPRFDLVLLGMGPDGHTASLFPGTKALDEQHHLVVSNWVGKFYTDRITLTAPVLNNAALVMFLVNGSDKAPALKAVLEGPIEPSQLPAQLIRPQNGRLVWLIDRTAGTMLKPR